jgi:hypothetical protein
VTPTFSTATFRSLLSAGLEGGFRFVTFAETPGLQADRVCAIRHDIDSDPGAGLTLAEIEAEEGVRATYFVMLRSPVYNVFARANQQLVEQIAALGHAIGLHYDPGFPPACGRSHTEQIDLERRTLEEMLGLAVGAVAFHQPSLVPGAAEIEVEGAVKANGLPGYHFLADPNQSPRVFEAFEVFRTGDPPRLQLLVHPMWWVGGPSFSAPELWERAILADWERSQRQLLIERAYGPPRRLALEPDERPRAVEGTA